MNAESPDEAKKPQEYLLFRSPEHALEKLREDYYYWGERVTSSSFELSLGVIAANWAVYGGVHAFKSNAWAQTSVAIVVLGLVVALLGSSRLAELHRKRIREAEANHLKWQLKYQETAESNDPWPYTSEIEKFGKLLRMAKAWLPVVGGAIFVISLFMI